MPLYRSQSVQYKYVCYTSKQGGPMAHNLLHVNRTPPPPQQTQDGCKINLRLSTKAQNRPYDVTW